MLSARRDRRVETFGTWPELEPIGWSALAGGADLFVTPQWLQVDESPAGPWQARGRAYLALPDERGLTAAGLLALVFDTGVTDPLCRPDLMVAPHLSAGPDPAWLADNLLPGVLAGGWFNSRVLLHPALGPAQRRGAMETMIAAVEEYAASTSAGSVTFPYVGPDEQQLRTLLRTAGYLELPTGPRHVLGIEWSGYDAYTAALNARRRLRARKEHARITDSDVTTRVERLDHANVADMARLALAIEERYEQQTTQSELEDWFHAMVEAPIDNVMFTAYRNGRRCAATLWLKHQAHLYGFHAGVDYEASKGLPTYFETAYRMPTEYGCESGGAIRVLEYGSDADQAKTNRGTTPLEQCTYIKVLNVEAHERLAAALGDVEL